MKNVNTFSPVASAEEKKWIKMLSEGEKAVDVAKKARMSKGTFAWKLALIRERFGCKNTNALIVHFIKNKLL